MSFTITNNTNKTFHNINLTLHLLNGINLLQLPTEILHIVIGQLNVHDLRTLSRTCRLLYHISRKYHFGIGSPVWESAVISKIDEIPILQYRDGVWFNKIFYLPIFHKENAICWMLDLTAKPIKWIQKHLKIEFNPIRKYESIRYYAATIIKNFIYIFGGENIEMGTTTNVFYELNVHTFVLRILSDDKNFPSPRMMHTLDVIDNCRLVMFGGRSSFVNDGRKIAFDSKDFAIFNINTKIWTYYEQKSNIPYRRSLHNSCIINEKLYIYGGQRYKCFSSSSHIHDDEDISVFDFRQEKWYKLLNPSTLTLLLPSDWMLTTSVCRKPIPGKRMHVAMFAMHDRIAIFGGSKKEGWNNDELNRPWELMYLLSTVKHNWEYIRIRNLPQIEILTFYWESWNVHSGLFLIGKDKKDGKLIMGWIRDSTNIP